MLGLAFLLLSVVAESPAQQRVEAAQARVQKEPKSSQALNDLAFALCRRGRESGDPAWYDRAEAALHKSFQLAPENYDAQKLHIAVLLGRRQFREALEEATKLNHKTPDDIAGWGLLVDANIGLDNYDEAERAAQWILDLRPGNTLGFIKGAAVREVIGDPEGAAEFLDEARRRTSLNDPDEQTWLLSERERVVRGPSRQYLQKVEHATTDDRIKTYEELLKKTPGDFQLQAGLVPAYLEKLRQSGDATYLERASKLVDRMLAQDSGNLTALRFQNEVGLERHEFEAVAERAADITKFAPSDQGNWGNLGDALMELGEYERAGQAYTKMFALRPNLASYNRLAYFRFVTGDAEGAIRLMKEAVAAGDPIPANTAWCSAELGDIYFKTGKLSEAADAYRAALRLFPALHRAYAGLGKVEAAQGRTPIAIQDYEKAQAMVPMVEYAGALEDLYTKAGMEAKARSQRELIEMIEKLGKATNEKTNRNLALILADRGRDLPLALQLMETELPTRGDVYTWDALAWVLFKSGRLEESKAASAKAVRLHTPEPVFYYHANEIARAAHD